MNKHYQFQGMEKLILIFALFSLIYSGCKNNNDTKYDENHDLRGADWIGSKEIIPSVDSLMFGDLPAPIFRKEFLIKKKIKKATLYITAAGYYHATLNGERIGKNYLDPAWTNFAKRIYYSEYDLTEELKNGDNCIGVTLGNGFYNPLPMKMWGRRNLRENLPTGKPEFIARLTIEYSNGKTEEIVTDNSWKYSFGPIMRNNVYLGEIYDARQEIEGWREINFDDKEWAKTIVGNGPGGQLQKAFFPPIQVTDIKTPVSITVAKDGKFLVDMGVNFTGHYKAHLKGKKGDTITFRLGERIYENGELNPMTTVAGQIKVAGMGGAGAPDIAWQTDSYIIGDKTDVWFCSEFTFHTYRYLEISGLNQKPGVEDIQGISLNSNVKNDNNFSCSSKLLNLIQEATERTFLANLISVQSDCPAREKFGYGGDLNSTSEAFIYNFDMQAFYRKTIYDWVDAMNDSVFVDTAPYVGIKYCGLSWESAFLISQYNLYQYYNDTALVKELYDLDLKWMAKAARIHPNGIVDNGLGDHEAIEKSIVEVTGTGHYLECARIMKIFASIMGDNKNEVQFKKLEVKLKNILLNEFWINPTLKPTNKQTQFATLLYYNVIPEDEISAAIDSLLFAIKEAPSGHFTTGIFGTKFILEVLSRAGKIDEIYKIVNSPSYPGWGFMIDRGATTLWESWDESAVLNSHSNCHPMFGSVSEWFYRWLGGIQPDPENPGFKKFMLSPSVPAGLSQVSSSYNSAFGKIISNWKIIDNRKIFEITIPSGSAANVKLPAGEQQKIVMIKNGGENSFLNLRRVKQHFLFELNSGSYTIQVS